jgi:hypothetical protein
VTVGVAIRAAALGHLRWNQLIFLLVALVFVGAVAWPATWLARRLA